MERMHQNIDRTADAYGLERNIMQKKIALINDLSGFGRCSLTVWLPLLSALKAECLLMPTSILSNHTAYPEFHLKDLSDELEPWIDTWSRLGVQFDCVMTGYIASPAQAERILEFFDTFDDEHTLIITDPAMADHGSLYPGLGIATVEGMKEIVKRADLITPNLTEACLLTENAYREDFSREEIEAIARQLEELGPHSIVITGIPSNDGNTLCDYCYDANEGTEWLESPRYSQFRHGTGDVFSGVLAGLVLRGRTLAQATRIAGDFVRACLEKADEEQTPQFEGVPFELLMNTLTSMED